MKYIKTDSRERKALKHAFFRFLSIPLAMILLSSVLICYSDFSRRKAEIISLQKEQIVSAMLDTRDHIAYMATLARNILSDYIEITSRPNPKAAAETLFKNSVLKYPLIDSLRILDLSGIETLRVDQTHGEPAVAAENDLADFGDQEFDREITELGQHQFLFSRLDLNRVGGTIALDPDTGLPVPVLRISTPLEMGGQRKGYFVASFRMREYLESLRTSLNSPGCAVLMIDENGFLYNDADDENNFGFSYGEDSPRYSRTIDRLIPGIDLTASGGTLLQGRRLCSYTAYANLYTQSGRDILSESAPAKMIFMVCYDGSSAYANDLHFTYFPHLLTSWKTQLLVLAGFVLLYILILRLIFLYDRLRFTNLFYGNRYTKAALRQALSRNQFVNYYQPIVNIQDGTILGFEALSRWICRDQVLPPSMFMDEILHYQLGQSLDEHVFASVREDRKKLLHCPGFENAFISINCCQQTFNSLILNPPATTIRLTEAEKKYIVLELVENIIFNKDTQDRIRELYKHNILFAIDDFGTGYSNVAFIRSFENLKVKIDRTFVPVDTTNSKERVIIEAFVKMFIDQGLKLIVEGVETKEQIDYLRGLGVAGVQGFYFSHPMTIDQLVRFLDSREHMRKL